MPTPRRSSALESADRESLLRRRDFLGRTAALAGLAGMASVLPAETLVAEAAKHAARKPFPKPRDLPIDTFVVLMMENRSFDHYFGWHERADGKNAGLSYPNLDGSQTFPTHRLTPDFQGCDFRDPNHGWDGGRFQYNGGALDGFYSGNAEGTGSDEYALGYYLKDDLPFIPHVAEAFQLYDRYFCSIMASTYPEPPLPARGAERRARSRTCSRPTRTASSGRRSSTARSPAGCGSATTSPTSRSRRSTDSAG